MAGLAVLESMWNRKGGLLDGGAVGPALSQGHPPVTGLGGHPRPSGLPALLQQLRPRASCSRRSGGGGRSRSATSPLMASGESWSASATRSSAWRASIEHCRPSPRIGYIFGACDFVTPDTARKFLLATGARFVAGYQKAIPWTESMLVDCLFLSYLLGGTMKWVRTKHGERIPPLRALEDFEITHSENPHKVAGTSLPRLPARPRHHVLLLHARSCARAQTPARQLLRPVPEERGPGAAPRPRHLASIGNPRFHASSRGPRPRR